MSVTSVLQKLPRAETARQASKSKAGWEKFQAFSPEEQKLYGSLAGGVFKPVEVMEDEARGVARGELKKKRRSMFLSGGNTLLSRGAFSESASQPKTLLGS